jgi:hypothetical protein
MRRCFLAAGALTCLVAGPVQAANLLTNGDFSAGNSGFDSDYAFEGVISGAGQYTVTAANNINNVNSFGDWTAIDTDPTGGTGNILVANGSIDSGFGTPVWLETVSVTPDTNYTFSFFGVDVNADRVSDATLIPFFRSDDVTEGSALDTNGTWQMSSFTWNSGSGISVMINLIDLNRDSAFNDFAIGDFAFAAAAGAVPEASTWLAMLIGFAGVGLLGYRETRKLAAAPVG